MNGVAPDVALEHRLRSRAAEATAKMRVLCLIPTMARPGGAERVMSYLVAHLAEDHDVTLLTLDPSDAPSFYSLPGSVRLIAIDKLGGWGLRRLARLLARPVRIRGEILASAPDVVVSFMDTMNVTALISALGLGVPVVVSERNDPAFNRIGWHKELLRNQVYALARCVVMQTDRAAGYFAPSLQPKLAIIPNPVPPNPLRANPDKADSHQRLRIIAIGRLERQKGFDQLIEAFGGLAHEQPQWDLVIIGEGPEHASLTGLIERLDLAARVQIRDIVKDVASELAASHLMAFPSRYEGFPNALAEGLAVGLPAVGYREVSGVEDLIVDGKTGLLANPNEGAPALARALTTLMVDPRLRCEFGEAAWQHVARWAPRKVLMQWDNVLVEATRPLAD
jgi:glycosyltransferase involved in cell wall biosynthesis